MANRKLRIITGFLLLMAAPILSFGQEEMVEVRDLESWSSFALKYKVNDRWTMGLQEQIRLDNNSTELKGLISELNTEYEWGKHVELGLGLRWTLKNDNQGKVQGLENYFRYHLDGAFKHDLDRFSFKYRLRYQNKYGLGEMANDIPEQYLRLKLQMKYNIRDWKLDPVISGELFDPIGSGSSSGLSHYRFSIGSDYKIKGFGKIGLYYRMEKELQSSWAKTSNILRFKYTYTIKNK